MEEGRSSGHCSRSRSDDFECKERKQASGGVGREGRNGGGGGRRVAEGGGAGLLREGWRLWENNVEFYT